MFVKIIALEVECNLIKWIFGITQKGLIEAGLIYQEM